MILCGIHITESFIDDVIMYGLKKIKIINVPKSYQKYLDVERNITKN